MAISKIELKKQLKEMGVNIVKGNYVRKKDIQIVLSVPINIEKHRKEQDKKQASERGKQASITKKGNALINPIAEKVKKDFTEFSKKYGYSEDKGKTIRVFKVTEENTKESRCVILQLVGDGGEWVNVKVTISWIETDERDRSIYNIDDVNVYWQAASEGFSSPDRRRRIEKYTDYSEIEEWITQILADKKIVKRKK